MPESASRNAELEMELVYALRTLWERKWWVLGAFAAAVAVAAYLHSDGTRFGVASQEVLLDAPSSALGDLGRDIEPLTARTGVFARVLMSQEVVDEIGRDAGIPAAKIRAQGPPLLVNGIPDQATRQSSEGTSGYVFSVRRGDELPLLTVSARAPTPEEARRLASATTRALVKLVDRAQAQSAVPERRRLTIRMFGATKGKEAVEQPRRLLLFAAFLGVFGLGCFVILVGPGIVAALRTGGAPRQPMAAAGANGNGNRDMVGDPEWSESVDAMFERGSRPVNGVRDEEPLDAERRTAGDVVLRDVVLRDLERQRDS